MGVLKGSLSTSVLCGHAPGWRPFLLISKMASSLGLPPKRGRPREDEKNRAILFKETTFVIWNEVKTNWVSNQKATTSFCWPNAEMMIRCVI